MCVKRYTVANFRRYPIRRRVTKASALESLFVVDLIVCVGLCLLLVLWSGSWRPSEFSNNLVAEERPGFLAHQIGISVVFTHVRYFYTSSIPRDG